MTVGSVLALVEMDNFFLDLSSESQRFTQNTASVFRVQVQPAIPLKGCWEVALTEIALPYVKNIGENQIQTITGGVTNTHKIDEGNYASPSQIMDAIRVARIPGLGVRYDEKSRKVWLSLSKGTEAMFDGTLSTILGFVKEKKYTGRSIAENTVDMFRAIKPILFQTSLIAPQVFREDRRQVLRAIYQNSDYIEFSPKYIPVIDSDLEELSFQLTDKNNNEVDFLPGHVNFVLHFRRCNQA